VDCCWCWCCNIGKGKIYLFPLHKIYLCSISEIKDFNSSLLIVNELACEMENNEKNFMLSIHSKVACEDF
jgi:hypothetical protein